jgi:hypothetical protein
MPSHGVEVAIDVAKAPDATATTAARSKRRAGAALAGSVFADAAPVGAVVEGAFPEVCTTTGATRIGAADP